MKKIAYFLILVLGFTGCLKDEDLSSPLKSDESESPILINEIYSTGDPDWVELFNSTNEDIDISGYNLSDSPEGKYTLPSGTIVPANGYYVFMVVKADVGFSLSSAGESFYLWDTEDNLVDNVDFPALDDGISYGRTSDGGEMWATLSPTQGAANSNENFAPNLTANLIEGVNDNEAYSYTIVASDADGLSSVKLFLEYGNNVSFTDMAPIGGGAYKINLPIFNEGEVVSYYVVATDLTDKKTYFPDTAPEEVEDFTVIDGLVLFEDVNLSNENPASLEDIDFTVTVYDKSGVDAVRLYYVLDAEIADNKITVDLTSLDGLVWTGTIPGQADGTKISYYLIATDNAGLKSYYPIEEYDEIDNVISDFDHDDETTWPSLTVKPLTVVINEILGAGSPDFVELYNVTDAAINISGYKLHDSDPTEAYTIPNGTIIPAHGYFVLDCTGDGGLETLWKISSSGEDITLIDNNDEMLDRLLELNWPLGHIGLVGRETDGSAVWEIKTVETKGTANIDE
ncbi:MAG: lamin tail domain-containing protein [Bacteroidales bacterium]|nr:lamin tail domain-containing protein [Bacteroidales bacterium]MBN2756450.1 lamin tail domain-containing protein [Bacteroidales bacterium]